MLKKKLEKSVQLSIEEFYEFTWAALQGGLVHLIINQMTVLVGTLTKRDTKLTYSSLTIFCFVALLTW